MKIETTKFSKTVSQTSLWCHFINYSEKNRTLFNQYVYTFLELETNKADNFVRIYFIKIKN